jgi:hypothetical protein
LAGRFLAITVTSAGSTYELVIICLLKQLLDIAYRPCLPQETAEHVIAQLARDILQGTQVILGKIGRRDKQEKKLHLAAIKTIEINSVDTDANGTGELLCAGMLCVWHSNPATDPSTSQLFTLEDRLNDTLNVIRLNLACVN